MEGGGEGNQTILHTLMAMIEFPPPRSPGLEEEELSKEEKNGGLESRYFLIGYDTESDISSNYILTIVVVFSFFLLWKTLAFPFFVKFARDKCSDVE